MSVPLPHALDWCEESIERYKHYKKLYNQTRHFQDTCLNFQGTDKGKTTCEKFVNEDELFHYFCVAEMRNKFFQLAAYIYYFAIKQNKNKYLEIKEQLKIHMTESMEYWEEACENNLINEGHYKKEVEAEADTYNMAMTWCDDIEKNEVWWNVRARGKKLHTLFTTI